MRRHLLAALASALFASCTGLPTGDATQRSEHQVSLVSSAPSMQGQTVRLYVVVRIGY